MFDQVFSYVVTDDSGFAPNPYGGVLTLATCKPIIRRVARAGDWLLGTGSVASVGSGRVVFAARVSEVLPIEDYATDPRFLCKRPSLSGERWMRNGDNIYTKDSDGAWKQRRNLHHGAGDMAHDVSGVNVLVCDLFWYFGRSAPSIPAHLRDFVKRGPGHKRIALRERVLVFLRWLRSLPSGIQGSPFIGSDR